MHEVFNNFNWWAVLVSVIAYFMLGALWYSVLFSKQWMKLRGLTEEDIGEPNPLIFVWTFLLQCVAVVTLAVFIAMMGIGTAAGGAFIGIAAGAGLIFTLTGNTALFADVPPGLHLIDNGYHVIALTIAGTILGAWL